MTDINGIVFVIIGAAVSLVSYRVGPSFTFFFWLGMIMFIYGVIKIVMQYLKSQTGTKANHHVPHHVNQQPHICPRCKSKVFPSFNFCAKCGYRLR